MCKTQHTALITGSATRIGRDIALSLASAGWNIAIHYHHSEDDANTLKAAIIEKGQRAAIFKQDLSDAPHIPQLVTSACETLGPIDLLVNNASHFQPETFETLTPETYQQHMTVNLEAPLLLMQQFVHQLPEGQQGHIINILDYCVATLPESFISYTLSQCGLWNASKMMARTLAPKVRVNAIGPGPALANTRQSDEKFTKAWQHTPLECGTSPEEICQTITFLLNTPSITGQLLFLDGGRHLDQRYNYI